jgi:ketol-acid reductoisomerase
MKKILEEIRSGAFAKELFADDDAGRPRFRQLREEKRKGEQLEEVGKKLRDLAGKEGLGVG